VNILSIHNLYQIRGGEDESREAEETLLRNMGHDIDTYEENNFKINEISRVEAAARTLWSYDSYRIVTQHLEHKPYDLVHIQNFFPLISPAVHHAAKRKGIPVVQTLRNYRLLCANGCFFRDGRVCEDCVQPAVPYPALVHACYRDNRSATAVVTAMQLFHRLIGTWSKTVDAYITISQFARNKFIQNGLPADKIFVKPNFVSRDPGLGAGDEHYAVFVGRLSPEKGVGVLLESWQQLGPHIPLKIIGDGPLSDRVAAAAEQHPQIEWLGRRPLTEVYDLIGGATFLVFPSEWYETFGRVAVEAFAKGTPVIASKIGAIAELVDHERTGLLFNPGDADDLVEKVNWFLAHPHEVALMRQAARAEFEAKYTAERNYDLLMSIYKSVLSQ
jgi:glycosyltransferase involved in cell wall biosynthesis